MEPGFTTQEQAIRECGRGIARIVRYWKPVNQQMATCRFCGRRVYSIQTHRCPGTEQWHTEIAAQLAEEEHHADQG